MTAPYKLYPTGMLYCGDCLEIMQGIEDKSVDLVLTDPPYGIGINQKDLNFGDRPDLARKPTDLKWDDFIPDKKYFNEIFRISKNQIIFGGNYFFKYLDSTNCYIIWDKRGYLPDVPFMDLEFAWTSFDKKAKKYTIINHGFIKDSKDIKYDHPTQKPSELFISIINDFTKINDLILDPFLGSGTTAVAAIETGRRWIGIEINESYIEIADKRIRDAYEKKQQIEMFK